MQGPGPGAAHKEGIAELLFAGIQIGNVTERTIEGLEAVSCRRIDHLGHGVVPQVLLHRGARRAISLGVFDYAVIGVPPTDAGGLHTARSGQIGGAEANTVHTRTGGADGFDIVDALGGL